jgi:hypothetical protein
LYVEVPPPADLGTTPPDGVPGDILPGTYTVVNINANPVHVSAAADAYYDLIFYESEIGPGSIYLDQIIIGISQVDDGSYYEVFNWGDNNRDENTNVDFNTLPPDTSPACTEPECDNREIPVTELHTDTTAPPPDVDTGILIDVDNAPGKPPEGDYGFVVIIAPASGAPDAAQVDAVVVEEVPIVP